MPIHLSEETNAHFLTIQINGKVTGADYERFLPQFEQFVSRDGKLRVLFDITGFEGFDISALWQEIKFDVKHFRDIKRLAVIGDRKWEAEMTSLMKPLVTPTMRYFDHDQIAEARQWLVEDTQ